MQKWDEERQAFLNSLKCTPQKNQQNNAEIKKQFKTNNASNGSGPDEPVQERNRGKEMARNSGRSKGHDHGMDR